MVLNMHVFKTFFRRLIVIMTVFYSVNAGGSTSRYANSMKKAPRPPIPLLPTGICTENPPGIGWRGDEFDSFEILIGTEPSPDTAIIWESGEQQVSEAFFQPEASLPEKTPLYVWIRLKRNGIWGEWNKKKAIFIIRPLPDHTEKIYTFDLNYSRNLPPGRAFEEAHLVSALQGIANRESAKLYVYFINTEFSNENVDQFWMRKLREKGCFLEKAPVEAVPVISDLLELFRNDIKGVVLWDPEVPATSNVASTIAGTEDLLPVPKNESPDSLYSKVVLNGPKLPVKIDLAGMFTGQGAIPGVNRRSTGSKKCDAYIWALEHYLKPGKCNPLYLGYYIDAWWIRNPEPGIDFQNHTLTNHDYFISNRAFFWDLSVWEDETPVDDQDQPPGTDYNTLIEILETCYEKSGGKKFIHVGGFTPWAFKYTSEDGAGGQHGGVETEWRTVELLSAYNALVDADALHLSAMANASFYRHLKLPERYSQTGPPSRGELIEKGMLDKNGNPLPVNYLMHYVGDFDSAAWLNSTLISRWNSDKRGKVKMSWALNPNLAERAPHVFEYFYRTRTSLDYFTAGDSGAGYINPTQILSPRKFSGLPPAKEDWIRHCIPYYRRFDYDFTGFLINGLAGELTPESVVMYHSFSVGGVVCQNGYEYAALHMKGRMPVFIMQDDLSGDIDHDAKTVHSRAAREETRFLIFRSVLKPVEFYYDLNEKIIETKSDLDYIFCSPDEFSMIARLHMDGSNDNFATYLFDTLPDKTRTGENLNIEIALRNDGWNAWKSEDINQFSLCISLLKNNHVLKEMEIFLQKDIDPGDSIIIPVQIDLPETKGELTVQYEMQSSGSGRFSQRGVLPMEKVIMLN